jgi:uncharacterized membrane protein YoaK (UPF0700 family)
MSGLPAKRARDILLVLLGFATGATDATAFVRVGHVFASVITGNLILLGISAEQADGKLAVFGACALGGYGLGVMLGAPGRARRQESGQRDESLWPVGTTKTLILELGLLIAFAILWEAAGTHPSRGLQLALLALAAGAMGAQSTAVRRLGGFSTTYLTSTLTGVLEEIVARRWSDSTTRSVLIIMAAVGGAASAIAVITQARSALPALPLVPLIIVLVTARRRFHR